MRESGASLVEMIIGMTLLAVIGGFVRHFTTTVDTSDRSMAAYDKLKGEIDLLADMIQQDLKLRDMTGDQSICAGGAVCSDLSITLFNGQVNKFESRCVNIPNNAGSRLDGVAYGSIPSKCFASINGCNGAKKYPVVEIERKGAKRQIPDLSKGSVAAGSVGLMVCGESQVVGTEVNSRLTIEGFYLNPEGLLQLMKRQVIVPGKNSANVQLLPK